MQQDAKQKIQELVEKYEKVKTSRSVSKYTEEETKKDFILPLFRILGWDVDNRNEVTAEEHQSAGRVDYGFYLGGRLKFYLEAKPLRSDLNREDYANQAVKYSWNKGATWAILTDFESLKVFNAQDIDSSLANKLVFEIPYAQYLKRFNQLWLLSKKAFTTGLLDKDAEEHGKKLQRVSVSLLLYKDLDKCREILSHDLYQWNSEVDRDLLDEGVQKILDRLIFLRVAEDREIEPPTLLPLIRDWDSEGGKKHLYESMVEKFRELDEVYNSNLFSKHPFEKWQEYSWATEKVIKILEGKKGYYEYDFAAMPADVLGSVYENYLGYRLSQSKKGVTLSKDAKKRKEYGIYYTPDFIVDYIVKNTLKPVLDKCKTIADLKKIKVLDPACGSGSFLIKALEVINDKYIEFGNRGDTWTKLDILLNNIYGVDLDQQAVEIARLNLLINALDKRMKLPNLDKNIRNGNSLISGTDEELKEYFGNNFREQKPFNWKEEFPVVFEQGGFDVIISNPPYIDSESMTKNMPDVRHYIEDHYSLTRGNWDIYIAFFELAINLTVSKGVFTFITPDKWTSKPFGEALRTKTFRNMYSLANAGRKVFGDAKVDSVISSFIKQDVPKIKIFDFEDGTAVLKREVNKEIVSAPYAFDYLLSKNLDLLQKMSSIRGKISDFALCENACATSDAYKLSPLIKNLSGPFDKTKYLKIINTGTIGKFYSKWGIQKMSYLGHKYLFPVVEKKEFLKLFKNSYASKSLKRKVIVKGLNLLDACLDFNGDTIPGKSTLIIASNSIKNLRMIEILINSKLSFFYIKQKYPASSYNQGTTFTKEMINTLPVPNDLFTKESVIDLLTFLVDKISQLAKLSDKTVENSTAWTKINSDIEIANKQINAEIYKLYSLTQKEIEIVEGGKNVS